jgi:hypothetical protein
MPIGQVIKRGMISTADRTANVHPEDWRSRVFEQMPVGRAPMTAVLQAAGSRPTISRKFHWFAQGFYKQRGDVTDVYTNEALSSAYSSGGSVGDDLYIKMTAADARQIVRGDTLLIHNSDTGVMRQMDVDAVKIVNDTHTHVAVTLLEDDTGNSLAGANLTWRISGNAQPEGSPLPPAIHEDVIEYENAAQIFMESLEFTGTELAEEERISPKVYARAKRRAFLRLRAKMERAFIFGKYKITTGANGKPKYYTRGIYSAIEEEVSGNIWDWKSDSNFAGKSWLAGGMEWLQNFMEETSRYSETNSVLCLCGSQAWLAINQLVEDHGFYKIETGQKAYGINVDRLIGLNRNLNLVQSKMFTEDPAFRRSILVIEPNLLTYRPMRNRDMTFVRHQDLHRDGFSWVDGRKEGWYVQAGLEYDNLDAMGFLSNLGVKNTA